jgi:hypothetical protein
MGRLYDEKSKSSNNLNIIGKLSNSHLINTNKTVIKNIESNITDLKNQLNSYEKAYETITTKLDLSPNEHSSMKNIGSNFNTIISNSNNNSNSQNNSNSHNIPSKSPLDYNTAPNNENSYEFTLKLKENELNKIKEFYEREIKNKGDIYEQNISHLARTHQEEIKKMRIEHETKVEEIIKKSEEDKLELSKHIIHLEKDLLFYTAKNEANIEILDFQKKYLHEMKDLQTKFEEFKMKTFTEFNALMQDKEELTRERDFYQENFEKVKEDFIYNENLYKENYNNLKQRLDGMKIMMKNNEILKNQLELARSEINFLKMKIAKLESSEKSLHGIIMEKERQQCSEGGSIGQNLNNNNLYDNYNSIQQPQLSHKSCEMVNYENNSEFPNNFFSPVNNRGQTPSQYQSRQNEILVEEACDGEMEIKDNFDSEHHLLNNSHNLQNLKSTHQNLKQRTQSLNLNNLNHNLNLNLYKENPETLNENLYKAINLKNAHLKIKHMEDCLRSMNEENDTLKGRLGDVISCLQTPSNQSSSRQVDQTMKRSSSNTLILQKSQNLGSALNSTRNRTPIMNTNNVQVNSTQNSVRTYNNTPHNEQVMTERVNSHIPSQKTSNCSTRRSSNIPIRRIEEPPELEIQETLDDNIIEFPLQVKIKGKIRKITTSSNNTTYSTKKK